MPSFDIVSEVDKHTLTNAVDQANRVLDTRFDFRGVNAKFERNDFVITLWADVDFQLQQMLDILHSVLLKNKVDIQCLTVADFTPLGKQVKQEITVRIGIESLLAKKIVKLIKTKKLKVQAQIQGEQIRVTGKKRDDLQTVIAMLKKESLDMPLQYKNFKE